jgi:hypothetical protein
MSKPFELSFQCEVPWNSMTETGPGRRSCGECHREVLDLSAHTKKKADEILRRSPDLCVNFRVGMDGAPVYQRPKAKRTLAVLASGLLAACSADEPTVELTVEPVATVETEPCLLDGNDGPDAFGGPLSDAADVDAASTEPVATQLIGAPAVEETTARTGDRNDTGRRGHRNTGPVAGPPHPPRLGGIPRRLP